LSVTYRRPIEISYYDCPGITI